MKKEIHPTLYPVVFVDRGSKAEFVTTSTLKSDETKDIKGVPHYIIYTEISSASHPFYTGKQVFVDTARRVEKFQKKMEQVKEASATRKGKKVKRAVKKAVTTAKKAKKSEKKEEAK